MTQPVPLTAYVLIALYNLEDVKGVIIIIIIIIITVIFMITIMVNLIDRVQFFTRIIFMVLLYTK